LDTIFLADNERVEYRRHKKFKIWSNLQFVGNLMHWRVWKKSHVFLATFHRTGSRCGHGPWKLLIWGI